MEPGGVPRGEGGVAEERVAAAGTAFMDAIEITTNGLLVALFPL